MKTTQREYQLASTGLTYLADALNGDEIDHLNWLVSAYLNNEPATKQMVATVDKVAAIATPGFDNIKAFRAVAKVGDKEVINNNGLRFELERHQSKTTWTIVGRLN